MVRTLEASQDGRLLYELTEVTLKSTVHHVTLCRRLIVGGDWRATVIVNDLIDVTGCN